MDERENTPEQDHPTTNGDTQQINPVTEATETIVKQETPKEAEEIIKIAEIQRMNIDQLNHFAKRLGLRHLGSLTKSQMVFEIVKSLSDRSNEVLYGEGVLEILPDGFGFLRSPNYNYLPSAEDIYVSPAQIRRFDLKKGDTVTGTIRPPREKEKYFALLKVDSINGTLPKRQESAFFLKISLLFILTDA